MYGIWNGMTKRFVFGIRETTEARAWRAFVKRVGKTSYKWRYEVRRIPEGWVNPPNPVWR